MRDFKGMKRQRGRNRGSSGGGGKPQHNANRSFDSNGPEGIKVRGAAQGVYEKYTQLARDAASGGDRVLAENYLQHAEHYFRTVRAMQPQRPPSEIIGREGLSGLDIDFEAEPEEATVETNEGGDQGSDGDNGDRDRDRNYDNNNNNGQRREYQDRPRFENRNDGQGQGGQGQGGQGQGGQGQGGQGQGPGRRDRWRDRDDRPRDDRPRDDRPRDDRPRDDRPRDDRPRDDRPRDDRPRDDRPRDEQPREPQADRPERVERAERPYRERRDRDSSPEPVAASRADDAPASPRLRGQDGTMSEAPAFLSRGPSAAAPTAPTSDDGEAPKPRRGRPKKIVASEGED